MSLFPKFTNKFTGLDESLKVSQMWQWLDLEQRDKCTFVPTTSSLLDTHQLPSLVLECSDELLTAIIILLKLRLQRNILIHWPKGRDCILS